MGNDVGDDERRQQGSLAMSEPSAAYRVEIEICRTLTFPLTSEYGSYVTLALVAAG